MRTLRRNPMKSRSDYKVFYHIQKPTSRPITCRSRPNLHETNTHLSTTATDTYPNEYYELSMSFRQFLRYLEDVHQHPIRVTSHDTINHNPAPQAVYIGEYRGILVTQDNIMSTSDLTHIKERLRLATDGFIDEGTMNGCPDDISCQIVIVARLLRHRDRRAE